MLQRLALVCRWQNASRWACYIVQEVRWKLPGHGKVLKIHNTSEDNGPSQLMHSFFLYIPGMVHWLTFLVILIIVQVHSYSPGHPLGKVWET